MESWFQVSYTVFVQQLESYKFQYENPPPIPPGLRYVSLLVSKKRAQRVHAYCKPLLSKTSSQQSLCSTQAQPSPAQPSPAQPGLRSVVPGHWLCISTGSRWHSHSSGVHNKQTPKQPLESVSDVSNNAIVPQNGGSKSEEVIWFWPYSSHPWRQPPVSSSLQEVRVTMLEGRGSEWGGGGGQERCHMTGQTFEPRTLGLLFVIYWDISRHKESYTAWGIWGPYGGLLKFSLWLTRC